MGILNGIAEIFREEAAARHIELHYTPLPYPVIVQADPARLQQIVWNLLKNAIKFTPRGGEIRITMYQPAPGRIAVDVSDTGIGIPRRRSSGSSTPSTRARKTPPNHAAAWGWDWPSPARWRSATAAP